MTEKIVEIVDNAGRRRKLKAKLPNGVTTKQMYEAASDIAYRMVSCADAAKKLGISKTQLRYHLLGTTFGKNGSISLWHRINRKNMPMDDIMLALDQEAQSAKVSKATSKLSLNQIERIRKMYSDGTALNEISRKEKVSRHTVDFRLSNDYVWGKSRHPPVKKTNRAERACAILLDFENGELSQAQISRKHGVTESCVFRIRIGQSWSSVKDEMIAAGIIHPQNWEYT